VPRVLARFEITGTSKTGAHPWSWFLREEALALSKSGRTVEAGLKLGAAAAFGAYGTGSAPHSSLAAERRAAQAWAESKGMAFHATHVRAGAAAAASKIHRSPRRLGHLLRPELWAVARTRRAALARISSR
jgi:hypothetical protein